MRPSIYIARSLSLATVLMALGVSASLDDPEIVIETTFPESNPFGHVVNGERNQILLLVENKSDKNVTLQSVAGSFHHSETGTLIKNTSSLAYGIPLLEGSKLQIPYSFYSEYYHPIILHYTLTQNELAGRLELNIWLDHTVDDDKYRVTAYDSVVTIVEPEPSWLDLKLLSTYLIVFAALAGVTYTAYNAYVPSQKPKRKRPTQVSAPIGPVTASGSSGYQEEWIPEHHLKKTKGKKTKPDNVAVSEESSSEANGTEGKRTRKGKK
ncbi:uncharacterized protein F5891DRAFT_1189859 [Suillus fuscotomentosus]|uniref:Translocon-associated protein subunit alpha n=1 Tax=Suillus fuscotomentosus TaxID=1912939 RepID=A0AAD4E462_9AGAM|nr:uncharacterized protein F5891DRAFT_1189859 [Suillus fuscotomentosus]KAG1899409.1 hypothetical protein F5891DRAFT_1189859 [Suillus fuscotomentosus]